MMKKLVPGILTAALISAAIFGASACAETPQTPEKPEPKEDLQVYAPDGAPALALVHAIAQEKEKKEDSFDFKIVNAEKIVTYVTGASPAADICVLPVNAAAKALGTGTAYQMLGTITNGNLYFLTVGEETITKENFATVLIGKRVGVVQLANVPGLTFQATLSDYQIPYQTVSSADAEISEERVNLIPFTPENVTPAGGCDFYLCPEPAMSAKIKGTSSSPKPFKAAGDLQELYGGEGGYPQAVVVAKKSVIQTRKEELSEFLGYLEGSEEYLSSANVKTVADLIREELEEGLTPSLNEKNLTAEVIERCSVRFTASKDCKEKVKSFLEKLIKVNENSTAMPEDEFFYMGTN